MAIRRGIRPNQANHPISYVGKDSVRRRAEINGGKRMEISLKRVILDRYCAFSVGTGKPRSTIFGILFEYSQYV
jgi:hypothetical protein